ncbi:MULTISPECIES: hypothetical protein [Sphingomonadales]|uniref:hypothetical protein n=2 Tax=Alphaproteobacteria TaxID=28211 RepID=UPI000A072AFA|nr:MULTISPECIES: hypothetical protein [Sphingomonadaceae]WCP12086.1 hypothetical protein sphantq_00483 [Sphingobium sp. AntQ-1]
MALGISDPNPELRAKIEMRRNSMATQPEFPPPDTIEPQSPPEAPPGPGPAENPFSEPPEIIPDVPDQDYPGRENDPA